MAKFKFYDGTQWVQLQESLAGGTLLANTTPIITLKRSASSSGAFIGFKSNNQDAKIWFAGQDSSNNFRISYSSDSGSSSTKELEIDTSGNLAVTGSIKSNNKAVVLTDDPRLSDARNAADVSSWAKSSTKPSYNLDEVSDGSTRKLANYVPKTLTTTKGDIIYASAANTPARLGIGSSGQILRVSSSGVPEWATVSTGGGSGTLYERRVCITNDEGTSDGLSVGFTILSNDSSNISDTIPAIAKHVYDCGYVDGAYAMFLPATGIAFSGGGGIEHVIMGVYAQKNGNTYKLYAVPADGNYYPNGFELSSSLYCFVHTRSITLS